MGGMQFEAKHCCRESKLACQSGRTPLVRHDQREMQKEAKFPLLLHLHKNANAFPGGMIQNLFQPGFEVAC